MLNQGFTRLLSDRTQPPASLLRWMSSVAHAVHTRITSEMMLGLEARQRVDFSGVWRVLAPVRGLVGIAQEPCICSLATLDTRCTRPDDADAATMLGHDRMICGWHTCTYCCNSTCTDTECMSDNRQSCRFLSELKQGALCCHAGGCGRATPHVVASKHGGPPAVSKLQKLLVKASPVSDSKAASISGFAQEVPMTYEAVLGCCWMLELEYYQASASCPVHRPRRLPGARKHQTTVYQQRRAQQDSARLFH